MAAEKFDLVVIGGGPGGYVAAIRATQLGLKTALIEKEHLGGICLNWGCIPSKALLRSAEIYNLISHLDEFGFSADNIKFDANKIVSRSRRIANKLAKGVQYLLKKNNVTVFMGFGQISSPNVVEITNKKESFVINAKDIILSTGAHPKRLPSMPTDDPNIWTYREAMLPEAIPESITVIGSGAIGVEFASFYRDMGSSVTLIESLDSILPVEDIEIAAFVAAEFKKEGTEIQRSIIYDWRFPRIITAIIGGIALAVAGALMQGCLGNPLVSPLTLGVASGAALGAALAYWHMGLKKPKKSFFEFSIYSWVTRMTLRTSGRLLECF